MWWDCVAARSELARPTEIEKGTQLPDRARIRGVEAKMASGRATPDRAGARPYRAFRVQKEEKKRKKIKKKA